MSGELRTQQNGGVNSPCSQPDDEALRRSVYDHLPVMAGLVEIEADDLIFVWSSTAAAKFFASTPEVIQGRRFSELGMAPEICRSWAAHCRESEQRGSPVRFEYTPYGGDPVRSISVTVHAFEAEDFERTRCSFLIEDVTEHRQKEQQLLRAERSYKRTSNRVAKILESISDAFFTFDRGWRLTYINSQGERLVGRPRTELIGKILWKEFPQELGERLYATYQHALIQQVPVHGEERFEDYTWLQIHAYPSQDGVAIYMRDVTEERRAREGLRAASEQLRRSLDGMIRAMSFAIEVRDPYTAIHQQRVGTIASAIARELGYSSEQAEEVRIAGLLHDVGKIAVPAEIMSRPGPLTAAEFSIIKMHTQIGYNILSGIEFSAPLALVALQHHERLDGSGYPQGLMENEILSEARIMAIADVVEAMASHRPYRPALGTERALEEILHNRGILYDAAAVDACFELFREHGFDFEQLVEAETREREQGTGDREEGRDGRE